ncbi:MAG: DNA adenine methylase [Phycisphaerae bacterium]|nr:DNA adenine methylase [Phycisphaerae bacterium]MDD5380819.1 DNA adenine methylase [Phycisphaerae bacterium]
MSVTAEKSTLAKPFLKWAGGKSQLLDEIEQRLPHGLNSGKINTYVEPFVGGGAVFFYISQNYPSIKHFYLFDINQDLVNCYNAIKTDVESTIDDLKALESEFLAKRNSSRKDFYYHIRAEFNADRSPAKLIFLNKTCYNGLYRVNGKDGFNVPFGDYKNPTICDEDNLRNVSGLLQNSEIICGDFTDSEKYIDNRTFVYFDPPYRPLNATAGFTSYSKDGFLEQDQIKLAEFCSQIHSRGAKFLLSNSDPKNEDPADRFFEKRYKGFNIDIVKAARVINCQASGRGQINELLITNYVNKTISD